MRPHGTDRAKAASLPAPAPRATFDVGPGSHVGPYHVGQSINEVIDHVKHQVAGHPVGLAYNADSVLASDVELNLAHLGLKMRFHGACQRLKLITVYDLAKIRLTLNRQHLISAPDARITLEMTWRMFGPTRAGSMCRGQYTLPYEGMSLGYDMPSQPAYPPSERELADIAGRLTATSIAVGCRSALPSFVLDEDDEAAVAAASPSLIAHLPEPCELCNTLDEHRPKLLLLCADPFALRIGSPNGPRLALGDACQDVLTVLGAPQRQFCEARPPLAVGNAAEPAHAADPSAVGERDYFYNYFWLGLDVLFDGATHTAKSFLLHTNVPGYKSFGVYNKANFALEVLPEGIVAPVRIDTPPLPEGVADLLGVAELAPRAVKPAAAAVLARHYDPVIVTPDTQWFTLKNLLGLAADQPVVLDVRDESRYSRTDLHGHANLIFEIVEDERIASVTLFADSV